MTAIRHRIDPGPSAARRRASWRAASGLALLACALLVTLLATAPLASGRPPRRLTLFSVAEQEQYVNNADDLARGEGKNPFGDFTDVAPITKETQNGPFPGDEAVYSFNVYANAALTRRVGIATLTCQYNFAKNAFCDASFQLHTGTLIGEGAFNFNASSFQLAITGGAGGFAAAEGEVKITAAANHAQELSFQLA